MCSSSCEWALLLASSILRSSRFLYMNVAYVLILFRLFSVDPGLFCTFQHSTSEREFSDTDKLGGHEEHLTIETLSNYHRYTLLAIN